MQNTKHNMIHKSSKIGANLSIGFQNIIEKGVILGNNVQIGHNVVIKQDTRIGNNVTIQDFAVVGKPAFFTGSSGSSLSSSVQQQAPLDIGDKVLIGTRAICYSGTIIMNNVIVADNAIVREGCIIEEGVRIGKNAVIEWNVKLEVGVKIQAFVLIGEKMIVGAKSFIGPHVSTACDKTMGRDELVIDAPIIGNNVCVGENSTLFPGIKIGSFSIIGAGSLVRNNVPENVIFISNEGRIISKTQKNKK